MKPKQILEASLLDIIFDDRNKAYGAYYLRATYPQRIKKAMLFTFAIIAIAFAGLLYARSLKPEVKPELLYKTVELTAIAQEEKTPEPLPPPQRQPEPPQVRTEQFTPPDIVDDDEVERPLPTVEDMDGAKIDVVTRDGIDDPNIVAGPEVKDDKGIIEQRKPVEDNTIHDVVQIPARYDGNWEKFLFKNLNANVPVDNGAPEGRYTVMIQFVVDKTGNLSDIRALTEVGYGMEQEAMRVLRKAKGWKPGIQAGFEVASYHRQPITFVVQAE